MPGGPPSGFLLPDGRETLLTLYLETLHPYRPHALLLKVINRLLIIERGESVAGFPLASGLFEPQCGVPLFAAALVSADIYKTVTLFHMAVESGLILPGAQSVLRDPRLRGHGHIEKNACSQGQNCG